jgi:hypothetical protein
LSAELVFQFADTGFGSNAGFLLGYAGFLLGYASFLLGYAGLPLIR